MPPKHVAIEMSSASSSPHVRRRARSCPTTVAAATARVRTAARRRRSAHGRSLPAASVQPSYHRRVAHELESLDYADWLSGSLESARVVVPLLVEATSPRSVVDVGCGIGSWLAAFQEAGVEDVLGVDGLVGRPGAAPDSERALRRGRPAGAVRRGTAVRPRALPRGRPDPAAGVRRGARGQSRRARRRRRRSGPRSRGRAAPGIATSSGRPTGRSSSRPSGYVASDPFRSACLDRPRREVVVRPEPRLLRAARGGRTIAGARSCRPVCALPLVHPGCLAEANARTASPPVEGRFARLRRAARACRSRIAATWPRGYEIAQLNIARALAPLDSPQLAGFMEQPRRDQRARRALAGLPLAVAGRRRQRDRPAGVGRPARDRQPHRLGDDRRSARLRVPLGPQGRVCPALRVVRAARAARHRALVAAGGGDPDARRRPPPARPSRRAAGPPPRPSPSSSGSRRRAGDAAAPRGRPQHRPVRVSRAAAGRRRPRVRR